MTSILPRLTQSNRCKPKFEWQECLCKSLQLLRLWRMGQWSTHTLFFCQARPLPPIHDLQPASRNDHGGSSHICAQSRIPLELRSPSCAGQVGQSDTCACRLRSGLRGLTYLHYASSFSTSLASAHLTAAARRYVTDSSIMQRWRP